MLTSPPFNALRASKKLILDQPLFVLKYTKKDCYFCKKNQGKALFFTDFSVWYC